MNSMLIELRDYYGLLIYVRFLGYTVYHQLSKYHTISVGLPVLMYFVGIR